MILQVSILVLILLRTGAQSTPSTDTLVLNELIPSLNVTNFLLNGPDEVSYARTTPTTNIKPSKKQMMYYNYYCAAMYCKYQLEDLSCNYCKQFKYNVDKWKGNKRNRNRSRKNNL